MRKKIIWLLLLIQFVYIFIISFNEWKHGQSDFWNNLGNALSPFLVLVIPTMLGVISSKTFQNRFFNFISINIFLWTSIMLILMLNQFDTWLILLFPTFYAPINIISVFIVGWIVYKFFGKKIDKINFFNNINI